MNQSLKGYGIVPVLDINKIQAEGCCYCDRNGYRNIRVEGSKHMWAERKPNDILTESALTMVEDMERIDGDILVLGASGKMGHTIYTLASKAMERASIHKKVIAVSRSHDPEVRKCLEEDHMGIIQAGLRDLRQLENLPEVPDVIYVAGRKFGTDEQEWMTWGVNSVLPASVGEKYEKLRTVVLSSGSTYPIVSLASGGCAEKGRVAPVGGYAKSCPARERTFEYYSSRYGTKVFMYRLNFVVDLKYGILADIVDKIMNQIPVPVTTPCFNCIWQGSAAEIRARSLLHVSSPSKIVNVTGPEVISVRKAAEKIGGFLGREPIFEREGDNDAYLNNTSQAMEQFGCPAVPADTLIHWQAEWVADGGRNLGLPMHFEERGERY